jgi:hypothetical protein
MKKTQKSVWEIVFNLVGDFSSELDLHYEDKDAPALFESLANIRAGALWLEAAGHPVPEVYRHVARRFSQGLN